MNKYIEFKQIPFKGKTKRFEIISKTSFEECKNCSGSGNILQHIIFKNDLAVECYTCGGLGKLPIKLGRISWYPQWRQYAFSPAYPTVWNHDCMNTIIGFIIDLMEERKK